MFIHINDSFAKVVVLEGKFNNKYDVVMELIVYKDNIIGKYYEKKYGVDIFLTGNLKSINELLSFDNNNETYKIVKNRIWRLNIDDNNYIVNLIENGKLYNFYPVKLYSNDNNNIINLEKFIFEMDEIDDFEIYNNTKYNYNITNTKEKFKFNKGEFTYFVDDRTKIFFPYLNSIDGVKKNRVNKIIKKKHMKQSIEALSCFSRGKLFVPDATIGDVGYSGHNTKVIFFDNNYLSMMTNVSVICGYSVIPMSLIIPLNIDIKNNSEENFDEFKDIIFNCEDGDCHIKKSILDKASYIDNNFHKTSDLKVKNDVLYCIKSNSLLKSSFGFIRLNENDIGIIYEQPPHAVAEKCNRVLFSIPISEIHN